MICTICHQDKPEDQFFKRKSAKGFYSCCKPCNSAQVQAQRRKKKAQIEFLGLEKQCCSQCGIRGVQLNYHHVNPHEKSFELNNCWTRPLEDILKEIDKCVVLCQKCHHVARVNTPTE